MRIHNSLPRHVFLKLSEIKVNSFFLPPVGDETWKGTWEGNWSYETPKNKECLFGEGLARERRDGREWRIRSSIIINIHGMSQWNFTKK